MAAFDFIDTAGEGYKFVWEERRALARLAFIPFIVKLVSYFVILAFALEENLLRQGWLLIPSYFVEAWLIVVVMRFAILQEAPGTMAASFAGEDNAQRKNILSAILIYVLMKLAVAFVTGSTLEGAKRADTQQLASGTDGDIGPFFISMAAIAVFIWGFRFIWLYVPVALNYNLGDFIQKIRAFMSSVYMLGFWMICFLPFAVLVLFASEILLIFFPTVNDNVSAGYSYAMAVIQVAFELMIALVSSVGMGHAVVSIMNDENKRPSLF